MIVNDEYEKAVQDFGRVFTEATTKIAHVMVQDAPLYGKQLDIHAKIYGLQRGWFESDQALRNRLAKSIAPIVADQCRGEP